MYDWANSAFVLTVTAALLGPYIATTVAPDGFEFLGIALTADSLFPYAVGISAAFTFLIAPVLGAIADFAAAKKRLLLFFAYMGAAATLPLYFSGEGSTVRTLGFFIVAQTCFVAANVFYDAFLPSIASAEDMDRISARGYIYGYIGGSVQFTVSLLLFVFSDRLGISQETAVQISLAMAGIWWSGFTLFTVKFLKEPASGSRLPEKYRHLPGPAGYVALGFSRTWQTALKVGRFKHRLLFLVAFMFYNDGIQTVIVIGASYGRDVLGLSYPDLMLTLLMTQIVAAVGAFLFTRLAGRIGTKNAVLVTIAIWAGVVIYAYNLETRGQYFIMGAIIGIVLGGSQALSRSLYGSMVPEEASAEFYGFYSVFSKFSAIWGPFVFATTNVVTGSSRTAILSLILFFVVGFVLLYFVDEKKARVTGVFE
jgi:UMF1 family MFS transporter